MESYIERNLADSLAEKGYWPAEARQLLEAGEYEKVIELCRQRLEQSFRPVSGRVMLARALMLSDKPEEARREFLKVLETDSRHMVALKYLGDISFQAGEEAAAMAYYREVREIDPNCAGLSCPLPAQVGETMRTITLKRPSEKTPKVVERKRAEPPFVTETIGDIYLDQGYYELAGEVYRRLLDVNPDNRIADKLRRAEEKLTRKE